MRARRPPAAPSSLWIATESPVLKKRDSGRTPQAGIGAIPPAPGSDTRLTNLDNIQRPPPGGLESERKAGRRTGRCNHRIAAGGRGAKWRRLIDAERLPPRRGDGK